MFRVNRREFLQQSGVLALGAASLRAGSAAHGQDGGRRLNAVLFVSDEHNPKVMSVSGHPMVQTPNLDRLAREGTVYENCYCPSPLCMPCRSSFVSGRRVHEIQTYNNCNVFSGDYLSYGQALREQGAHSVHIGKMDVYRPSAELGFSEVILPGDRARPGDRNVRRHPLKIREDGAERAGGYGPKESPFKGDDDRIGAAIEWLRAMAPKLSVPWMLSINTNKPHFPHHVTQELWDRYPEAGDLPAHGREEASANHPYARDLRDHFQTDRFSDEDIRGLRRGYLGCVTYIDQQIGAVLATLEETGLLENTVFAYTSDHGEMLGKFGMWWKCSLYEDSARVPLLIRGPGFEAGRRVTTPVDLHDLRAGLFHALGAAQPSWYAGEALQTLPANSTDRVAFGEYHGHGVRGSGFLIRKGDWKLIYNCEAPHQLFNLAEDPEELRNLAEANPAKRKELEEHLRAICDPEKENHRAEVYITKQLEAMA